MVDRTGLHVAPLPGSPPQGTSPTDGRLVMGALFGTGGGCISGGALTASATLMQVTVAAAVWRIPDPTNAAGVYLAPADAAQLTFSAGPASGSRIDVLWVRQNNFEAGDANSRVVYGVAVGTASSTPTAPAIPAGAMKIGQLTVPTGVSNAAAGPLVPAFGGQGAATPPAGPRDTFCHLAWGSTTDQAIPAATWTPVAYDTVVAGSAAFVVNGAGGSFTFPWAGRYSIDARWAPRTTTSARFIDEVYASGSEFGAAGTLGGVNLTPHSYHYELVAAANTGFQHRVYADTANAIAAVPTSNVRPELIIRYLGPA